MVNGFLLEATMQGDAQTILWASAKLVAVFLTLVYLGMVWTAYAAEGTRYQPRLRWRAPARSGERLLVWTGVKIVSGVLRFSRSLFNQLFAASAEVGLWVADKSGPEVQRKVRSKFL
jgi:hypothetical protein